MAASFLECRVEKSGERALRGAENEVVDVVSGSSLVKSEGDVEGVAVHLWAEIEDERNARPVATHRIACGSPDPPEGIGLVEDFEG